MLTISDSKAFCAPLVFPFLVGVFGLILQDATYLNHDVAWVLYSSGRLLDGGTFGRDIIAANPPLIWWISEIPMYIAREINVSPVVTFRVFVGILGATSLTVVNVLVRSHFSPLSRSFVLTIAAYLFFWGVHRDYGQREHFTLILALPYLISIAMRWRGERLSFSLAAMIGIAAGVGFAFKPHLLIVPFVTESLLAVSKGNLRVILRTESIAAVSTISLYVSAVFVLAPVFIMDTAPSIARIYWGFSSSLSSIALNNKITILLVFIALIAARLVRSWPDPFILSVASVGFLVAALAQSKGYSYHFYPSIACALLALAVVYVVSRSYLRFVVGSALGIALAINGWESFIFLQYRSTSGRYGVATAELVQFVRDNVPPGGRFLALSTHPYPGFPTALYADRDWSSASNSRIFIPAIVRLREGAVGIDLELQRFAEAKEMEALRRDFDPLPDLVLVDIRPSRHAINSSTFDFLGFYRRADWFNEILTRYREAKQPPSGFRAFVLKREPHS